MVAEKRASTSTEKGATGSGPGQPNPYMEAVNRSRLRPRPSELSNPIAFYSILLNVFLCGVLLIFVLTPGDGNPRPPHGRLSKSSLAKALDSVTATSGAIENAGSALEDAIAALGFVSRHFPQCAGAAAGALEGLQRSAPGTHRPAPMRDEDGAGFDARGPPAGRGGTAGERAWGSLGDRNGTAADGEGRRWLAIGIPTVQRRSGARYLSRTLDSLLAELPLPPEEGVGRQPFGPEDVVIVVMDNSPAGERNEEFEAARRRFGPGRLDASGRKARALHPRGPSIPQWASLTCFSHQSCQGSMYIRFVENPGTCQDPTPDAPPVDDLNNPKNIPGKEVRKQTCDLVSMLELAAPLADFYYFMEDDFHVCGHMMRALHYLLQKVQVAQPDWLALRMSYGMNGVAMQAADVPAFSAYLRKHVTRLPPDLLWQEWTSNWAKGKWAESQGEKRPLVVYRYNMLKHIGDVSSFAVRPERPAWPGCYDSMQHVWSLSANEKFDGFRCREHDISPCRGVQDVEAEWAHVLPVFGVAEAQTPSATTTGKGSGATKGGG